SLCRDDSARPALRYRTVRQSDDRRNRHQQHAREDESFHLFHGFFSCFLFMTGFTLPRRECTASTRVPDCPPIRLPAQSQSTTRTRDRIFSFVSWVHLLFSDLCLG